jgi:hypothetical protein
MAWPYAGYELFAAFGVQPNAYTPVAPTIPFGVGPSPDLNNSANLESHYGYGDFIPQYLKAGAQESGGRLQLQMLPSSAQLLQCGVRSYDGGSNPMVRVADSGAYSNTELPWLTIGISNYQQSRFGSGIQWSQMFVGCKLTDLSVSLQERESITFSAGWLALYGMSGADYQEAIANMGVQAPIKWHESRFYLQPIGGSSDDWSAVTQAFSWNVRQTVEAVYGTGPWASMDDTASVPDFRDRCPKTLKETTQEVSFNWQSREMASGEDFVPDTRVALLPGFHLATQHWDSTAVAAHTTDSLANIYLDNAKFSSFTQRSTAPNRTVVWSAPGTASGARILLSTP